MTSKKRFTILTAQDALNQTIILEHEKELKKIEVQIYDHIYRGFTRFMYSKTLSDNATTALREAGYRVEDGLYNTTVISWTEA